MRVPIVSHSGQHLELPVFFILDFVVGVKGYFFVSYVYIFLITMDVEHLYLCLLAMYVCICVWKKSLFNNFPHYF